MRKKHTLLNCSPGALPLPAGLPPCLLEAETLQPAHASCGSPAQSREAPELQVIPPLPRNAEPIARLWAGLLRHEARPRPARAPQAACRLAVAAGAGARFLLGVGGAGAAAEAAGERAHVPRLRPCSVHEHRVARLPAGRQPRREAAAAVGLCSALSSPRPPPPSPPPPSLAGRDPCPRLLHWQSDPQAAAEQPAQRYADLSRCRDEAPCGASSPEPALRGPAARAPESRPPTRPPLAGRSA